MSSCFCWGGGFLTLKQKKNSYYSFQHTTLFSANDAKCNTQILEGKIVIFCLWRFFLLFFFQDFLAVTKFLHVPLSSACLRFKMGDQCVVIEWCCRNFILLLPHLNHLIGFCLIKKMSEVASNDVRQFEADGQCTMGYLTHKLLPQKLILIKCNDSLVGNETSNWRSNWHDFTLSNNC